jgi:hypothetical protein
VGDSTVTSLGTVQAGTTAALPGTPTFNATANTFTWSATNKPQVATIDGVTLANGDRILVKNQATSSQNGVYTRTTDAVWTRIAELNETTEFQYGVQATIGGGTTNNGRKYYLFAGNTLNAGSHQWSLEIPDAALLTGGPVTIGRDVVVLNTTNTGISTLGGNTAHNSTFSGGVTLNRATTLTAATGGTVNFTGNITANGNNITKAGAGKVVVKNVRAGNLTVSNGTLEMSPDSSAGGTSKINTLNIAAGARVDLQANKLFTSSPIGTFTGGAYTGVQGEVARAYDFGSWDLPGLMTSQLNASPTVGTTTIGVSDGASILFLGPTETGVFSGQTVTGATTLAVYTYAGDVNFDGLVDASDYGIIDNYFQFPGTTGYANGDFNYDGVIDAGDYGIIDNTFQLQGAPIPMSGEVASLSGVAAVPEPASLSVLAIGAAALLGRRRRRRV